MTAETAAFFPAIALAICWWIEIRQACKARKAYADELAHLRRERDFAHSAGWEEGRLYEYNRREPKRGQGGRFAPKKQDAATAELLEP